mmetsp:Transcript_15012/g.23389  ORF Transcript_15012/g.23389 Transcript_15012/m.23389 type:complete len:203 (-) Transcript_15012:2164-2772(-)
MNHNKSLIIATGAASGGVLVGLCLAKWIKLFQTTAGKQLMERRHEPGTEAHEIETHILNTQKPAGVLGIRVQECNEQSLSLSAPLELNHNVHGTAFAGSLYAVAVLCSYYLGRAWVRRQDGLHEYQLVAKSGSIQYQRPLTDEYIVAQSILPSLEELNLFQKKLLETGKAAIEIGGAIIRNDGKVACEYKVEVCAFRPRNRS